MRPDARMPETNADNTSSPPPSAPAGGQAAADKSKFVRNTLARLGTAVIGIPILLYLMFWAPWYGFQIVVMLAIAITSVTSASG